MLDIILLMHNFSGDKKLNITEHWQWEHEYYEVIMSENPTLIPFFVSVREVCLKSPFGIWCRRVTTRRPPTQMKNVNHCWFNLSILDGDLSWSIVIRMCFTFYSFNIAFVFTLTHELEYNMTNHEVSWFITNHFWELSTEFKRMNHGKKCKRQFSMPSVMIDWSCHPWCLEGTGINTFSENNIKLAAQMQHALFNYRLTFPTASLQP